MSDKIIPFVGEQDRQEEKFTCNTKVYRFTNETTGEVRYHIEVPEGRNLASCRGCYWRIANVLMTRGYEADFSDPSMIVLRGREWPGKTSAHVKQQLPTNVDSMERQSVFQLSRALNL